MHYAEPARCDDHGQTVPEVVEVDAPRYHYDVRVQRGEGAGGKEARHEGKKHEEG
jgi:hypothetical protein